MMGTQHHILIKLHITEGELRQSLIIKNVPETVKRGITGPNIVKLILITITLLMMNINHVIEKYVVFVVYITMRLLSARREWKQEK